MPHTIYLSLGTNLGRRADNLTLAIDQLRAIMEITEISTMVETKAWGVVEQPNFLNLCVGGTTELSPYELLEKTQQMEVDLGRVRLSHWGPRTIDIDILLYDDLSIETDVLTIPHPEMHNRAFVIVPLAEIAPTVQHPTLTQSIAELYEAIDKTDIIRYVNKKNNPFIWGHRTYVMGILNATPDSFSGDGLMISQADWLDQLVEQATDFLHQGADILDIGGESTRPNSDPVSAQQEQDRVLPAIEALRSVTDAPISIDSYRAETARLALKAGATWINDVWGLQFGNQEMAEVAASADCPVILMHNGRNRPKLNQDDGADGYYGYFHYDDLLGELIQESQALIDFGIQAGISAENIMIDPGIGFGKTAPQNKTIITQLHRLKELGYPILLGTSRKGFIGRALGGLEAAERIEGTAATIAIGIDRGADMIRVHDVKQMARVARMTDSLIRIASPEIP